MRSLQRTLNASPSSTQQAKESAVTPRGSHTVVHTAGGDEYKANVNDNNAAPSEAQVQPSSFVCTLAFVQTDELQALEANCNPMFLETDAPELQEPHISERVPIIESQRSPSEEGVTTTPVQCATTHSGPPLPPKSPSEFITEKTVLSQQIASRSTFRSGSQGVSLKTGVGALTGGGINSPTVCTPTKSHEEVRRDLNDMLQQLPAADQVKFLEGKRKVCLIR